MANLCFFHRNCQIIVFVFFLIRNHQFSICIGQFVVFLNRNCQFNSFYLCVFFVGIVNSTLKTVEQRGQHHWKSRLFPLYGHVCRTVLCGSNNGFLDQMVPHSQSHSHRVSDGILFNCVQCISRDSVRQRQKNFYTEYLNNLLSYLQFT